MASIAPSFVALLWLALPHFGAEPPCGSDRWPVKTLTDEDRDRVSLNPIPTSIRALASIAIHEVPYPSNRRLPPEELRTNTVRARVVARRLEADQDLHVILADPDDPETTLIAEVPLGRCAAGSLLAEKLEAVRTAVLSVPIGSVVLATGVGFFDFIHNARGQAPNGFELHPLFQVERDRTTEQPSAQSDTRSIGRPSPTQRRCVQH
jgi:hypothetical protein